MRIWVEVYCGDPGGREGGELEDRALIAVAGYENLTRYPRDARLPG